MSTYLATSPDVTICENHDTPGACTTECLALTLAMSEVHTEYVSDPDGVFGGPPMPVEDIRLTDGRVHVVYVHPVDCWCVGCAEDDRG